jgi:hypothetical protein
MTEDVDIEAIVTQAELRGVDFSCAPSARKPITVARGRLVRGGVRLQRIDTLRTLAAFEEMLAEPGPWLGAFDFPFGLPRAFVDAHALGSRADAVIEAVHARCASRRAWQALIDGWGHTRPPGRRLLHRRTDGAVPGITSSSPLQSRYVPVAFMWFEGFVRVVRSGVRVPWVGAGDGARIALEGYPGLLAFELAGRRSYKNADAPDRRAAREAIVDALAAGRTRLGLRLLLDAAQRELLVGDASGDHLDAVLCLMQAAWASTRPNHGIPADIDPVEGWIATA